jgi:hypothetical protein
MIQSNKRKLNLFLLLAACLFISIAATKPSTALPGKSLAANDTTQWKNLQVLPKDISRDSLDEVMHHFTKALGVHCSFCHAPGDNGHPDFPSDAKEEKNIARYMMKMTADINKNYFNSENSERPDTIHIVQCMTCHHGSPHPNEAMMAGNDERGNMPPPPPPPQQQNQ